METARAFIVIGTLLALAFMALPATGPADIVTVKVITPDSQPTPPPEPGAGDPTTSQTVPPEIESPEPDEHKAADPAKVATGADKPLFEWPPPMVVLRSTVNRFGLTDEQKARIGPILNAADKEAGALAREINKDREERQAAIYRLRDVTMAKLLPLLDESQARRLDGAVHAATVAPRGVRVSIGPDGILAVAQPAPSAIAELWLAQYAPGVDLAGPQASDLMEKLQPLAEQYAQLQSDVASTLVNTGDKDDPEWASKVKEERVRQEKEWVRQQRTRREIVKSARAAISQVLSPDQRQAARDDRRANLEAGVRHILDYYRGWLSRPSLNLTAEQKQKMQELIDAASDAISTLAAGDEDQFPALSGQLWPQLKRDLVDELTAEQKERLLGPTSPRPTDRKGPPKQGDNQETLGPVILPPL